jgi:hypothetical protein
MSETGLQRCGLAADTKVETPEGSMAIRTCAGKSIPVLSRNAAGEILFRMMREVRKVADAHPVLKVTLVNGESFRVAPEQIIFLADSIPLPAARLTAGMHLFPAFHYPRGYEFQADDGQTQTSDRSQKVARVEAGSAAEVYALGVNETACFFLAAGILCSADGS